MPSSACKKKPRSGWAAVCQHHDAPRLLPRPLQHAQHLPPRHPRRPDILPVRPYRYALSLHDALPISVLRQKIKKFKPRYVAFLGVMVYRVGFVRPDEADRSEEHTSELQSHSDLVCRLLLAKKSHDPAGQQSASTTMHRACCRARCSTPSTSRQGIPVAPIFSRSAPTATLFPYTTLFRSPCCGRRSRSSSRATSPSWA